MCNNMYISYFMQILDHIFILFVRKYVPFAAGRPTVYFLNTSLHVIVRSVVCCEEDAQTSPSVRLPTMLNTIVVRSGESDESDVLVFVCLHLLHALPLLSFKQGTRALPSTRERTLQGYLPHTHIRSTFCAVLRTERTSRSIARRTHVSAVFNVKLRSPNSMFTLVRIGNR